MSTPPPEATSSSDGLLTHISTLPRWEEGLDDDPNWVVPVSLFGLETLQDHPELRELLPSADALAQFRRSGSRSVPVNADTIWGCGQRNVRLDAVAHYLQSPDWEAGPFDPDPWFGLPLPLITELHPGLVVLDGVSRTIAARLSNRPLHAYRLR